MSLWIKVPLIIIGLIAGLALFANVMERLEKGESAAKPTGEIVKRLWCNCTLIGRGTIVPLVAAAVAGAWLGYVLADAACRAGPYAGRGIVRMFVRWPLDR